MKKLRLGDLLVENNVITSEELELALVEQKESSRKLGDALVDLGTSLTGLSHGFGHLYLHVLLFTCYTLY